MQAAGGRGCRFVEAYAPRLGVFAANDALRTTHVGVLPGCAVADELLVTAPTRLVVLRVTLDHPPTPLPPARLTVIDANGDLTQDSSVVPVMDDTDGSVEFLVSLPYPAIGSVIAINWGG
jgi:hypothetical protein